MHCNKPEPWNNTDATYALREMGKHPALSLAYKVHATQRLSERGTITPDVLQLIRTGFVYADAAPAKNAGYYKYQLEGLTPNSGGRVICAIVIPNSNAMTIKVVTVLWKDEVAQRAGTIVEDMT